MKRVYKERTRSELSIPQQEFLNELEELLEKHDVYVCSINGELDSHVGFQFASDKFRNIECNRCHLGAYDLTYLTWHRAEDVE